jgi:hypothetical protein
VATPTGETGPPVELGVGLSCNAGRSLTGTWISRSMGIKKQDSRRLPRLA